MVLIEIATIRVVVSVDYVGIGASFFIARNKANDSDL